MGRPRGSKNDGCAVVETESHVSLAYCNNDLNTIFFILFSLVHATLQVTLSVHQSVSQSRFTQFLSNLKAEKHRIKYLISIKRASRTISHFVPDAFSLAGTNSHDLNCSYLLRKWILLAKINL